MGLLVPLVGRVGGVENVGGTDGFRVVELGELEGIIGKIKVGDIVVFFEDQQWEIQLSLLKVVNLEKM